MSNVIPFPIKKGCNEVLNAEAEPLTSAMSKDKLDILKEAGFVYEPLFSLDHPRTNIAKEYEAREIKKDCYFIFIKKSKIVDSILWKEAHKMSLDQLRERVNVE